VTLTPEQLSHLTQLENVGRLSAEAVVEDARNPTSPLHELINWDDEVAAHEHRLGQARRIIREVLVAITTTTTVVSVARYIPDPGRGATVYLNIEKITDDQTQRQVVIAEANRALGNMRRAESIAQALGLADGIHGAVATWVEWRDAISDEPLALAAD
jgi:hypothetical protein